MQWLDVRLAFRMMLRYPVLTLVACIAIGIGIPCALVPLQMVHAINAPLPFEDGDRMVGFDYGSVPGLPERNPGLSDLERWQSTLTTITDLGAAVIRTENVIGDDALTEIVRGAGKLVGGPHAPLRTYRPDDRRRDARGVPLSVS
jgi:hypothetical protein